MRSLAWAALVLAVIAAHGCIGHDIAQRLDDAGATAAMPKRIEVAYVRDMLPTAPPRAAAAPTAVPPPARAPRRAPVPDAASAASAPASSPQPVPADAPAEVEPPRPPEPAAEALPEAGLAAASAASRAAAAAEAASVAVTALAPEPAASAASDPTAAPFVWPASTRLRYVLTGNYRGSIDGSAEVQWVRQGERYQTHVDITIGLSFAPLLTRRMSSEGRLGATGLVPERYDEDSKVAFRDRRRVAMHFDADGAQLADGSRVPGLPGMQDTASQFVQMTWLFGTRADALTPGSTVELPLALPRNLSLWVYDVLDLETLHTPFGAVDAFHLRPRRVAKAGGDLTAEIWFAPAYRYLPVRIRIQQDADTFIDLMVDRPPQLAE